LLQYLASNTVKEMKNNMTNAHKTMTTTRDYLFLLPVTVLYVAKSSAHFKKKKKQ